MVRSVFRLTLSLCLVIAGLMLVVSGLQGSSGAVPQYQEVRVTTAAPSGTVGADLVNYGTDKDVYNRGDTANGYLTLRNTGSSAITDVTVKVSASRSVPILGTMALGSKDFPVSGLNIKPGDTKKIEFSVDIPKEYSGFSTAGNYQINGRVLVGGKEVGGFSKSIKVV